MYETCTTCSMRDASITTHTFYMAPTHCPPLPDERRGRKRKGTYTYEIRVAYDEGGATNPFSLL